MQKLSKHDYEAIASFDYDKNPATKAIIVVDPSSCNVALCICGSGRNVEAVNLWNSDDVCFEDEFKDILDFRSSEEDIRETVRRYYLTNKCVDKTVPGTQKTASELMDMFNNSVGNELETYLTAADRVLENKEIDVNKIRVIFVGNMARFFPSEVVARLHYSSALPMMADNRYGYYDNTDAVIEQGNIIIEKNKAKLIDGPVECIVYKKTEDGESEEQRISIVDDGENAENLKSPRYTPKIFAYNGAVLTVSTAEKVHKFIIDDNFFSHGFGMIRLGLRIENDEAFLIVDSDENSRRNPISIKFKGE